MTAREAQSQVEILIPSESMVELMRAVHQLPCAWPGGCKGCEHSHSQSPIEPTDPYPTTCRVLTKYLNRLFIRRIKVETATNAEEGKILVDDTEYRF